MKINYIDNNTLIADELCNHGIRVNYISQVNFKAKNTTDCIKHHIYVPDTVAPYAKVICTNCTLAKKGPWVVYLTFVDWGMS